MRHLNADLARPLSHSHCQNMFTQSHSQRPQDPSRIQCLQVACHWGSLTEKCLPCRMRNPRTSSEFCRTPSHGGHDNKQETHTYAHVSSLSFFCHTYTPTMSKDLYIYIITVSSHLNMSFSLSNFLSLAGLINRVTSLKYRKGGKNIQTDSFQFLFNSVPSLHFPSLIRFFFLSLDCDT